MANKLTTTFVLLVFIVVTFLGLVLLTNHYANLPERLSQHETILVGQNRLVPGSQAALRVLVRDHKDASPLPGAQVEVSLRSPSGKTIPLYQGKTDNLGTASVSFQVPEGPETNATLLIYTKSRLGSDRIERPVTLERDFRVLLTTDKPLYQPGQAIHIRALALSAFDLSPASGQELEMTIADGKGNKVFRKKLQTDEFGVAPADFQLAGEVNTGAYKITAGLGNTSSEKTVTVEHYVLPKFSVKLATERPYYLPGQHVKGTLSADYFFGKPVAGGQVAIEGFTYDVQKSVTVNVQGNTNDQGDFLFEFDLPAYLAGSDLEGGTGRFYLQASVTDLAKHSEVSNLSLPVAQNALVIEAIPEGGAFRLGVENILYVLTSYPDGMPAKTDLEIQFYESGQIQLVKTGPYGLAEVRVTPQSPAQGLSITAKDAAGNLAGRQFNFDGQWTEESVLLRPDRPVYRVGETMSLSLFTSQKEGTVYLDIVREGQTVSTRAVPVKEGQAEVAVDLTPDLFGTLELHAYKVLPSGSIVRDTRLVVVDQAEGLSVALNPVCPPERQAQGECVFKPGDTAGLNIQVSGQEGGVKSALGLAIVDESVFALAEQDPGFARLYFLLEGELLTPKYDLHGYSLPDLVQGVPENSQPMKTAIEKAAQASLSAATPRGVAFSLQANSHQDALQQAAVRQEKFFGGLSKGLYGLFLALPAAIFALSVLSARREKRLGKSLLLAAGLVVILGLAFSLLISRGDLFRWGEYVQGFLVSMGLLGILGFLALIVVAWQQRDLLLGWALILLLVLIGVLGFLAYAFARIHTSPKDIYVILGLLDFLLLPLAFLLRFGAYAWGKNALPALAALQLAVFLTIGLLPALALIGTRVAAQPMGGMLDDGGFARGERLMMAVPEAKEIVQLSGVEKKAEGIENTAASASPSTSPEPPRLRQYFPETMLWLPDAVTDDKGFLHLDAPVADSITTWRMTALASTKDGRLGSVSAGLRVFQDFFVDLDLPQALTVGDEVSLPVGVFNYLAEPQTVRLELAPAGWFELLDEPTKEIEIGANDIQAVYFRVRALRFGRQAFKVTAIGSRMSDAIQKEVEVYPNGKALAFTHSDRLIPGQPVRKPVTIPADAIPGTQKLLVKIYPGILSQVVEGLDSILRMPYGCFEQTSSTTYPNVLVLDYLKSTGQASPEAQMKAEEYINLGYQRLATFEVGSSGGFSLFGEPPADRMLTAYGLQEFADMSRVHEIDPALVKRAAEWLLSQQDGDGSWENDRGLVHENTWSSLGNDRLPVTAYIAWSLVDAGFGDDARAQKGLQYVREFATQAKDAYVLALVANALVSADEKAGGKLSSVTEGVLDRLAGMAVMEGNGASWISGVSTFMGSEGRTGSIETTALAALAFLRAGNHPELANAALTFLVQQKDNFGTWYSTQATVLSLKALLQSVRAGAEKVNATITVSLNGGQIRTLQVTRQNFDVVQLVSFDDANPAKENLVSIDVQGEGNLMYQVTGSYYLPWEKLSAYPELSNRQDLVTINVAYDRAELAVNDALTVNVTISLNEPGGKAESALIDLGLPPGFTVLTEDLAALVARFKDTPPDYAFPKIERYELTGRQILIYLSNLGYGNPLQFSYRLRAKFPLVAQTPASRAYDYYNPDVAGEQAPQVLVVK